ncbi:hypothetical protein BDR22DRAFT_969883 [Usnea florida]
MEPSHRRTVYRPQCAQDWEARQAPISEFYGCMTLDDMMKLMEEKYSFKATKKQYKTQLSKWSLRKNITAAEYKAMIRKKQKRERFGKARSAFRLRGAGVEGSDIIRFQKRKKICNDDEMSDVPTPSSLSCYTPTSDVRSRSPSLPHTIVPSSPTSESNVLVRRTIRLWTWSPATERLPVSMSDWFPGFDEYINLSAVETPTQSCKLSLFNSGAPMHLITGSLLVPITRFDQLHCQLDCETIDRSAVDDLQARKNAEQQRTQAIELQALTNDAADHYHKALFGTSAFAKPNIKLRFSISMNSAPFVQGFKHALFCKEAKTHPASSECYCKLESLVKQDQATLEIMHSSLTRLLGSKSRTFHAGYTPALERRSEEKSTKEPAYVALSHQNSNSNTNSLHARIPYLASSSASSSASSCNRSNYQRVTTHYPGSSDPTLSEAAEWNELMEC